MNILNGFIIISTYGMFHSRILPNLFEKYNLKYAPFNDYYNYVSNVTLSTIDRDILIKKDPLYTDEIFDIYSIGLNDDEITNLKD